MALLGGAGYRGPARNAPTAVAGSCGLAGRRRVLAAKGLVEPTDDFAVLTYEANATRSDGEPYHALVSSGYVKRAGGWKLAFHQQTPLRPAESRVT